MYLSPTYPQIPVKTQIIEAFQNERMLSSEEQELYLKKMNQYFTKNPYNKWFANWTNKAMYLWDTSHYESESIKNTAIHIDLLSPVPTMTVWGKMDCKSKKACASNYIFRRFIDILVPDILLCSFSPKYPKEFDLELFPSIKCIHQDDSSRYVRGYANVPGVAALVILSRGNNKPLMQDGKYIKDALVDISLRLKNPDSK